MKENSDEIAHCKDCPRCDGGRRIVPEGICSQCKGVCGVK